MLSNGGYDVVKIPTNFIAKLAISIQEKGQEWLTLGSGRPINVVGFMVIGKQVGERVIIIGDAEPKAIVSTEYAQRSEA
jgi:hypothetical protein